MSTDNDLNKITSEIWINTVKMLRPNTFTESHCANKVRSKRPHLRQLANDLEELCRRNAEGAYATQVDRRRTLLLCAQQLLELGVCRKRAINLNEHNVALLVTYWHSQSLTASTIRNRLAHLRWLARKINKPLMLSPMNRKYSANRGQS